MPGRVVAPPIPPVRLLIDPCGKPCTIEQLCRVFGLHRNEASKYLGKLRRTGRIRQLRKSGEVFYAGGRADTAEAAAAGEGEKAMAQPESERGMWE